MSEEPAKVKGIATCQIRIKRAGENHWSEPITTGPVEVEWDEPEKEEQDGDGMGEQRHQH